MMTKLIAILVLAPLALHASSDTCGGPIEGDFILF